MVLKLLIIFQKDYLITHYSSILGLAPLSGGKIIAYELEDHPTPESIKKISNYIITNFSEIESIYEKIQNQQDKKDAAIHFLVIIMIRIQN